MRRKNLLPSSEPIESLARDYEKAIKEGRGSEKVTLFARASSNIEKYQYRPRAKEIRSKYKEILVIILCSFIAPTTSPEFPSEPIKKTVGPSSEEKNEISTKKKKMSKQQSYLMREMLPYIKKKQAWNIKQGEQGFRKFTATLNNQMEFFNHIKWIFQEITKLHREFACCDDPDDILELLTDTLKDVLEENPYLKENLKIILQDLADVTAGFLSNGCEAERAFAAFQAAIENSDNERKISESLFKSRVKLELSSRTIPPLTPIKLPTKRISLNDVIPIFNTQMIAFDNLDLFYPYKSVIGAKTLEEAIYKLIKLGKIINELEVRESEKTDKEKNEEPPLNLQEINFGNLNLLHSKNIDFTNSILAIEAALNKAERDTALIVENNQDAKTNTPSTQKSRLELLKKGFEFFNASAQKDKAITDLSSPSISSSTSLLAEQQLIDPSLEQKNENPSIPASSSLSVQPLEAVKTTIKPSNHIQYQTAKALAFIKKDSGLSPIKRRIADWYYRQSPFKKGLICAGLIIAGGIVIAGIATGVGAAVMGGAAAFGSAAFAVATSVGPALTAHVTSFVLSLNASYITAAAIAFATKITVATVGIVAFLGGIKKIGNQINRFLSPVTPVIPIKKISKTKKVEKKSNPHNEPLSKINLPQNTASFVIPPPISPLSSIDSVTPPLIDPSTNSPDSTPATPSFQYDGVIKEISPNVPNALPIADDDKDSKHSSTASLILGSIGSSGDDTSLSSIVADKKDTDLVDGSLPQSDIDSDRLPTSASSRLISEAKDQNKNNLTIHIESSLFSHSSIASTTSPISETETPASSANSSPISIEGISPTRRQE